MKPRTMAVARPYSWNWPREGARCYAAARPTALLLACVLLLGRQGRLAVAAASSRAVMPGGAAPPGITALVNAGSALPPSPRPRVCVVVRTYWKHGALESADGGALVRLLASLQRQTLPSCAPLLPRLSAR